MNDGVNPPDSAPESRSWSLEGTTWVLTEIRDADGAWPLPGGIRSTMEITDGHMHVEAGCNTGHASVTVHDDTIQIGPMALTRMMCPDLAMKPCGISHAPPVARPWGNQQSSGPLDTPRDRRPLGGFP